MLMTLLALALVPAADGPTGIPGVEKIPRTRAELAAEADRLEARYRGKPAPESVRMLVAIARGKMGAEEGWFGPAQTRYTFAWLAKRCNADDGGVPRDKFPGPDAWFASLDRDKDGRVTAGDFDWSPRSPYIQASGVAGRLFRQMDAKGKGKVSKEDMIAFFEKVGGGKDHLTPDDLRAAVLGTMGTYSPGDAPSPEAILRGLFNGEIGSLHEGPALGADAPDFELPTADGKGTIRLSERLGKKPVVLVLGNYTCGPFRSLYPQIEAIKKKAGKDADFLMVYVREAHPTDGWRMKTNDKAGVAVAQPRSDEGRRGVARQCAKALSPTMPLVVDGVDDKVGNLYSGMPGRMYVLDRKGKVAYKSGRWPYGFKAGELEQAVVMSLLEVTAPGGRAAERSAPSAPGR